MSGPSAQVISPISLSDASERQGLSPEAPRTKHEQEDDGAIASDHDGRRKKPKRAAADKSGAGGPGKKFACPYFKRNRAKYSKWTSCPGPGWDEVHRVKTHLYRRHALPIQCPRCWGVFKSDELLRTHLQQNPPCQMADNRTPVEGFTKDQEKRLRSRKKAQADTKDEDKWREIYTILFPDDDESSIPSPYYDPSDFSPSPPTGTSTADNSLEDYTTFIRREMPTLVRRELETVMQAAEFSDVDARLRSRIADIVLTLQPRLVDLYKQSQLPLSEWGPSNDSSRTEGNDTTPATGTDSSLTPENPLSTPATAISDGSAPLDPSLGRYDGIDFTFDPNAELGEGFSWDEEFDNLLNPSLFMPQSGGLGLDLGAYQYVPQQGAVSGISGVPRTWGEQP
ncbi:hypothetical protein QBC34DRAFT_306863 [Podospora aff. communis PSN243]|uniref:C2H2-type domain-containing protein n=1 Tax=Podospora aff. communis PSN243 TaxID=3040156 RepID=A0AAV9GAI5_9PEZI|nr:hypothetical protein QBC34DRAFT_306863 [Podospora aff. communis PSN243]